MIAHFYIMAESFANNANYNKEIIEEKIMRLAEDVKLINRYKATNRLYTNYSDLYPQIFYSTYTVEDFICNPIELKQLGVDRDVLNAMLQIIERSEETAITSKEVKDELLNWTDEENCHGLLAFHEVEGVEPIHQVVYGVDEWIRFRRYFLGEYPKNGVFFIDECKKYFSNLFFHERNKATVESLLHNCSRKITYHLSALNDDFKLFHTQPYVRATALKQFSIYSKLDEIASPEGDASRKKSFTFDFINKAGTAESICCEPHLKLCFNDNYPGDKSYSTNRRIYFYEGKENVGDGKILIGHIGEHL